MDALVDLINDIKAARDAGRTDSAVTTAQDFQRRAQFYLDFIEFEKLNGIPCAAGGGPHSWRIDQLFA